MPNIDEIITIKFQNNLEINDIYKCKTAAEKSELTQAPETKAL